MTPKHYDLIVVNSSPGCACLAHWLAPTGKRILLLECGAYPPRSQASCLGEYGQDAYFITDGALRHLHQADHSRIVANNTPEITVVRIVSSVLGRGDRACLS